MICCVREVVCMRTEDGERITGGGGSCCVTQLDGGDDAKAGRGEGEVHLGG